MNTAGTPLPRALRGGGGWGVRGVLEGTQVTDPRHPPSPPRTWEPVMQLAIKYNRYNLRYGGHGGLQTKESGGRGNSDEKWVGWWVGY
eukprot:682954-Hanusia_phi.AAC.1